MIELLLQQPPDGITLSADNLVTGAVALVSAALAAGLFSRRAVKKTETAVQSAVNSHGADEMAGLEAIRQQLETMTTSLASTNQLMVSISQSMDARLNVVEHRLQRLESGDEEPVKVYGSRTR